MSLKRYAIIAAVSYHNSHNGNNQNITTTTTTPTPAITTSNAAAASQSSLISTTTATTLTITSNVPNNATTGNTFTTYYGGGLGLYHQQNIRGAGGGAIGSGVSGAGIGYNGNTHTTYPNTINGNVNLLLGGAMLSLVITILCVVCYCCHRNIKKRTEAAYRQQRQWLDNDPNMEIYSVEQCYETSGLFLGESTDGLSTLPTLHHEPPPSYDAVVAMQEQQLLQQQQQQLLQQQMQRSSPPPGYRSTLDVSTIAFAAGCSRGTPDGMAITAADSNGNLSGSGNIALQQKQLTNSHKQFGSLAANPLLNMKKVFNAQSCCSLQRAEVENMWNAAAAAVAARASHSAAAADVSAGGQTTPTVMMMARKSLPAYAGAKLAVNELGRRYLSHNYYRRGCPLCGKFRYEGEEAEEALSASVENALDNATATVATTSSATRITDYNDNNCSACKAENAAARAELSRRTQAQCCNSQLSLEPTNEGDECACSVSSDETAATSAANIEMSQLAATNNGVQLDLDANGNAAPRSMVLPSGANSNERMPSEESLAPASDDNANVTEVPEMTAAADTASASSVAVNLDSINENGIVRLDMSKIIDKTGLPTYEAALKLESSGYV